MGTNAVEKSHSPRGTRVIRQRVEVTFDYEVQFTRGLFRADNRALRHPQATGQTLNFTALGRGPGRLAPANRCPCRPTAPIEA